MSTLGGITTIARPSSEAFRKAGASISDALGRGDQRPELVDEIKQIALAGDPLRLYSALHILNAVRRSATAGPDHFGNDAVVEFYGGIVSTFTETDILPNLDQVFDLRLLWKLDAQLRKFAAEELTQHQLSVYTRERRADGFLDRAQHQIEFENLFDRMAGFEGPIRRIVTAIFVPLDDMSRSALGYRLTDALRLADLLVELGDERFQQAQNVVEETYPSPPTDAPRHDVEQWMAQSMAILAVTGGPGLELEDDLAYADRLGIPVDEFRALVSALAVKVGSQSAINHLSDTNSLRTHPILMLSSAEWLWARPVDFLHIALQWAAQVCAVDAGLLKLFDKTRQRVAEVMPHEVLSGIFGAEKVYLNPTYPSGVSRPDIDVLVDLPSVAIVVESKGGRFTDPARRGAPARIEKHAKDIVAKAREQNIRTCDFLRTSRDGLKASSGAKLVVDDFESVLPIVITLDRIDPFATHLGRIGRNAQDSEASWVLALADLLMIAEVLSSPSEFLAYCDSRVKMSVLGCPLVMVEADALGEWCKRRITPTLLTEGGFSIISETSQDINDYFTATVRPGVLRSVALPTTGVPIAVRDALDRLFAASSPYWPNLVKSVFEVPPTQWRTITRRLRVRPGASASGATRHARKKARRASEGVRIGVRTTLHVAWDGVINEPTASALWLAEPPD